MPPATHRTQVCIAGGGPAGLVLGYLLARCGIDTLTLESQPDFDRDFRGDTLHAGVMEIFRDIGLADRILELPHHKIRKLSADGRASHLRKEAALEPFPTTDLLEVLWFRLPRLESDPGFGSRSGAITGGRFPFILLERTDHYQIATVIPPGTFSEIRQAGLPAFHERLREAAPDLYERAAATLGAHPCSIRVPSVQIRVPSVQIRVHPRPSAFHPF